MAKQFGNRIRNMISRGVVEASDDTKKIQQLKGSLFSEEIATELQRLQEYGFTSVPLKGAEMLVVFLGGNRDNPAVISVFDKRHRSKNGLEEGEVAIYHHAGNFIHLKNDGTIEITASDGVDINGDVRVVGDIEATGDITDKNGSMQEMRDTYNTHTHTETGATTLAPNQSMN